MEEFSRDAKCARSPLAALDETLSFNLVFEARF